MTYERYHPSCKSVSYIYFDYFMRKGLSLSHVEAIPLFYGIISTGLERHSP